MGMGSVRNKGWTRCRVECERPEERAKEAREGEGKKENEG